VGTANPTAVTLADATVAFRLADRRFYTEVEQARLAVAHGEFVAIVGPTGCGKSTFTGLNRDAFYLFQADVPRSGWTGSFTHFTVRYGVCLKAEVCRGGTRKPRKLRLKR
jgi:hypothetical protein